MTQTTLFEIERYENLEKIQKSYFGIFKKIIIIVRFLFDLDKVCYKLFVFQKFENN